jgi:DNA-binding transcriptional ArsR family regulator
MTTAPDAAEQVLGALADPTRRQLLDRLAAHGETTATVLAAELPVSRQALVKHLSVLQSVGLVGSRRDGRERRYTVRPDQLVETARWMNEVAGRWNTRLEAIRRIAEQ